MHQLPARLFSAIRSHAARIIALGLLVGLVALRIADPVFVSTIRNQSFDLYQRIATRPYTPQPVVIADIDEKSLAEHGQWPLPETASPT